MSSAEFTTIVAIVIAVIAFFVTTAQLLQTLFDTADGYRRCQSSVIGEVWASKTKRRFLWSEFRFETIFSTPDIRIQSGKVDKKLMTLITGGIESRSATFVPEN